MTLSVFIEFNGQNAPTKINAQIVNSYLSQLKEIGDASPGEHLAMAMSLPDTLSSDRSSLQDSEKKAIFQLLDTVINDINTYRADEGAALEKDFNHRINLIEKYLDEVIQTDPERSLKNRNQTPRCTF